MIKVIHNATTGERIELQMSQEEIAEFENSREIEKKEQDTKNALKSSLLEKLGITEEEAKLLLS